MAPSNLSTSTHSFDPNPFQSQATPAATAFSSPSLVNQSNSVSVEDVLFRVLTVIFAVASVLLSYLQLVHMRNQARSHRPGTEILSIRKHVFCIPYASLVDAQLELLDGLSRQDSDQSLVSTSGDTVVEVQAPQEDITLVQHSASKLKNVVIESEVEVGVPFQKTAIERTDYGKSAEHVWTIGSC